MAAAEINGVQHPDSPPGVLVAVSVVVPARRYHNLEREIDRAMQQVRLDAARAFEVSVAPAS